VIRQILAADDLEIYYRESQNRESDLLVEEFVWHIAKQNICSFCIVILKSAESAEKTIIIVL